MPEHDEPDAPELTDDEAEALADEVMSARPLGKRLSKAERWAVEDKKVDEAETK